MRTITIEQFHKELKEQGTSSPEHVAVKCPVCGTVQSKALLLHEGCPQDKVDTQIGFSCVGRWNNAGSALFGDKQANPGKPGCDYTLGGLFTLNKLEVEKDGEKHPVFDVATPGEARDLEARLKACAE